MELSEALVDTKALQIAPAGQVFWYTSGTVGPYYINTHFLFGGSAAAADLLAFIDSDKEDRDRFAAELLARVQRQYDTEPIYAAVVDALVERIAEGDETVDMVSGGERRDWFFSASVADRLGVPHLLLYKDLDGRLFDGSTVRKPGDLGGVRICHVADLVTEASSYVKTWIPALERIGGKIAFAANVVDRAQGGMDILRQAGVEADALLRVDSRLFEKLASRGRIDDEQRQVLDAYFADPHGAMRAFLLEHMKFIRQALQGDERTAARARPDG